jgi:hypothetical protein
VSDDELRATFVVPYDVPKPTTIVKTVVVVVHADARAASYPDLDKDLTESIQYREWVPRLGLIKTSFTETPHFENLINGNGAVLKYLKLQDTAAAVLALRITLDEPVFSGYSQDWRSQSRIRGALVYHDSRPAKLIQQNYLGTASQSHFAAGNAVCGNLRGIKLLLPPQRKTGGQLDDGW